MNDEARQAFLDGYRHGLGDAVRRVEFLHDNLPAKICAGEQDMVRTVLIGLMRGLQLISASVVLADPNGTNDE